MLPFVYFLNNVLWTDFVDSTSIPSQQTQIPIQSGCVFCPIQANDIQHCNNCAIVYLHPYLLVTKGIMDFLQQMPLVAVAINAIISLLHMQYHGMICMNFMQRSKTWLTVRTLGWININSYSTLFLRGSVRLIERGTLPVSTEPLRNLQAYRPKRQSAYRLVIFSAAKFANVSPC